MKTPQSLVLLATLILFMSFNCQAALKIKGQIHNAGHDIKMEIVVDNVTHSIPLSNSNKFHVILTEDKVHTIRVFQPGCQTKVVVIDTSAPENSKLTGCLRFDVQMEAMHSALSPIKVCALYQWSEEEQQLALTIPAFHDNHVAEIK